MTPVFEIKEVVTKYPHGITRKCFVAYRNGTPMTFGTTSIIEFSSLRVANTALEEHIMENEQPIEVIETIAVRKGPPEDLNEKLTEEIRLARLDRRALEDEEQMRGVPTDWTGTIILAVCFVLAIIGSGLYIFR